MKHRPSFTLPAFVVLCFFVIAPAQALAYIDPATGSLVLQVLLAGILGALFFFKTLSQSLRNWFSRIFSGSPKDKKDEQQKDNQS